MKKKLLIIVILIISLLCVNQAAYLYKVQFVCTEKINKGEDLNMYEIFSALQTHTMFWMVGWVVEPTTAQICFCKQFHIDFPFFLTFPDVNNDSVVKKAKTKLIAIIEKDRDFTKRVKLAYPFYNSRASILLNGSEIEPYFGDYGFEGFTYYIKGDYKPGIIKIAGVTISETVFDYLENKGILGIAFNCITLPEKNDTLIQKYPSELTKQLLKNLENDNNIRVDPKEP